MAERWIVKQPRKGPGITLDEGRHKEKGVRLVQKLMRKTARRTAKKQGKIDEQNKN